MLGVSPNPHSLFPIPYSLLPLPLPSLPLMRSLLLVLLALCSSLLGADLRLGSPLSDHMVLQREKSVPVWGWAQPGTDLTISFAGQSVSAKTDQSGLWKASLAPLSASSAPRELTVKAGATVVATVRDVLVGEVWLGSGQSNMAMTVNRCADYPKEQQSANFPLIRMFREESQASEKPRENAKGTWSVCSPQTVGGFSGTLYFFGREIYKQIDAPVGLIATSWGGTRIEAWTSHESLAERPCAQEMLADWKDYVSKWDGAKEQAAFDKRKSDWETQAKKIDEEKAFLKTKIDYQTAHIKEIEEVLKIEAQTTPKFTPAQQKIKDEWDKWREGIAAHARETAGASAAIKRATSVAEASLTQPGQPAAPSGRRPAPRSA